MTNFTITIQNNNTIIAAAEGGGEIEGKLKIDKEKVRSYLERLDNNSSDKDKKIS
jgi:hypothetical protein